MPPLTAASGPQPQRSRGCESGPATQDGDLQLIFAAICFRNLIVSAILTSRLYLRTDTRARDSQRETGCEWVGIGGQPRESDEQNEADTGRREGREDDEVEEDRRSRDKLSQEV
jgi:hypothetical protein